MHDGIVDKGLISIEPIRSEAYLIRGHANNGGYGAAYEWSCVASVTAGVASILGFTSISPGSLTYAQIRAMRAFGEQIGVSKIDFSRIGEARRDASYKC